MKKKHKNKDIIRVNNTKNKYKRERGRKKE